jgi:hypothetical protein
LECGILAFDEIGKSKGYLLIDQMSGYFKKSGKGRERSDLVIPEPFFVHSDLTTGIQLPDFMAYIISWGFRKLRGMAELRREELDDLVERVHRLEYQTSRTADNGADYVSWSLVYISELCDTLERAKVTGDKRIIRECRKTKRH